MRSRKHILADQNIKRLLFKLSLPATTGMLVMALYNIIDTIFVGRGVGPLGIAGLSIVFPIQMIVLAIGQLFGIGGASVVSRSLGEGNEEKAQTVIGTVYLSSTIVSLLLTGIALLFKDQLLAIFGATEGIYPYARDYYEIIVFASVFFIFTMSTNNLLRSEGHARIAMFTMIIGAVSNIILDAVFIFGLKMGIRGAAWATVVSKIISVIYVLIYIWHGKSNLKIELKYLRIKLKLLKEVFAIGTASFIRSVAGSMVFALFNNALGTHGGDLAIAAYGIVQRFLRLIIMPLFGIGQGLQPIVGYNYGAKRFENVLKANRLAIIWATALAIFGWISVQLFASPLISIFTADRELIAAGAHAARMMLFMLPVVGFHLVGTVVFMALGKALPSIILSMSREILFLIPLILILPNFAGVDGVWITMPISDTLAALLTFIFFTREMKRIKILHDMPEVSLIGAQN